MFFGGFPGGAGGGAGARPSSPPDTTAFYKVLGVEKGCSDSAIKKAFRKLAKKHHPDRGGDAEKFKLMQEAYEVLSDPEKRKLYDEYGKEAAKEGKAPGGGMGDLFSMFGGGGQRSGPRRTRSVQYPLRVSLEDLYKGKTVKLAVTRKVMCIGCDGKGGSEVDSCPDCNGRGVKVQVLRRGNMIQQMQSDCGRCRGEGRYIPPGSLCKKCHGNRVVDKREVLEVFVEPGTNHNHKIKMAGKTDEAPGAEPGDIIFVVQEKEHPVFKRKGADLFISQEITLLEALTGCKFVVETLDGRKLYVSSPQGEILAPGSLKAVKNEGMPVRGNPYERGSLFVHYVVQMPPKGSITPAAARALAQCLPGPKGAEPVLEDDMEVCTLTDMDPEESAKAHASASREAYDSDDDDEGHGGGGQRVQCAQQ